VSLVERLHPAVTATSEEDVCRAYIEDLLVRGENYR
jgi:hypothetical protein